MSEVFEDGRVHVRAVACDQCLLCPDRIVSGARARQIVADTRAKAGSTFLCHKSQVGDEHACICRGWFDRFAGEDPILRLAVAMKIITEVADGQA